MRVDRLGDHHETRRFSSGSELLDAWLRDYALHNERRNLSRTYVLVEDSGVIVGYYTLVMGGVVAADLPRGYGRGLPLRVEIGMVLVARLAIATSRQGKGYGRDMLFSAIERSASAAEEVAARFVAVDPIDEAARRFYARFGFKDIAGDEKGRMFLRIDHALQAVKTLHGLRVPGLAATSGPA